MKYLLCYFFLFTVISFPVVYANVYSYVNAHNFGEEKTSFLEQVGKFKEHLLGTTVGSIGLNAYQCVSPLYGKTYPFECPTGELSGVRFILGAPKGVSNV